MCFGWGAVDLGGDFSSVVKMQKIGVTIKIRNSCMNNSVEALILFKVASGFQKNEVFKKDWNFASCSSFASCIMKKHFFQGGEKRRFFPLFALWNYLLLRWAICWNIFMFLNINTNQTSKEQDLNFIRSSHFFGEQPLLEAYVSK